MCMKVASIGILVALSSLPSIALAEVQYKLLAPLGPLPPIVTMATYLEGIIQVIVGVAGVLAVVMIVICGVQLIGSPSVSQKSASKECIWNAILGLMLAAGSWLILNTINTQLLSTTVGLISLPEIALIKEKEKDSPMPTAKGFYFEYKDVKTNAVRYQKYATMAECEEMRVTFQSDSTLVTVSSACFEVKDGAPGPKVATSPPPPTKAGSAQCSQAGLNVCEPQFRQCNTATCAQFAPMANKYAGGSVSANLIKAIIIQESSCGTQLYGPLTKYGQACGPTQLLVSTANTMKNKCGLDEKTVITCGWLANKDNWDKAVCLGAEYLKTIPATACTDDPGDIAAGYNAGPGRCAASNSGCAGENGCYGAKQQWECLYNDPSQQICNTGFNETTNYSTRVLYCTKNPGY
jgi:type IV secretory pathway VirB2 component (pilin)